MRVYLTTLHDCSSFGLPVLVLADDPSVAYGPADLAGCALVWGGGLVHGPHGHPDYREHAVALSLWLGVPEEMVHCVIHHEEISDGGGAIHALQLPVSTERRASLDALLRALTCRARGDATTDEISQLQVQS
jgi:hypothetical protein